jgi:glycerate 2-kinase
MGKALEAVYGPCEGLIVIRYGSARPCKEIEVVAAANPAPDEVGVLATQRMLDLLRDLRPGRLGDCAEPCHSSAP